ncbi:MAG: tail fiber domain-containing protein [Candidatus Gracilibacteria bacterium]|nr:tail fiber domain-containing protein [Candidatus Gracilibacteria bacterium]
MKLQKHIKEVIITISVISITAGAYAALSTVTNGDPLTDTVWNSMVADVNNNTDKLTNISSNGGNVGIGNSSPEGKLDINGTTVFRGNVGFNGTNPTTSTTTNDGFRIRTDENYLGVGFDYTIFEKTDTNAPDPDGGIAFTNVGNDGVIDTSMSIKGNGNIGMGTTIPEQKLHVVGNTKVTGNTYNQGNIYLNNAAPTTFYQDTDHRSAMIHVNSNLFYILRGCGTNSDTRCQYNSAWPLYINLENNNAHFGGNLYGLSYNTSSDKRLKKNINTLDNSLEKVSKLRGVSFDWKTTGEKEIGLIAQEVEEVYPDLVDTDEKGMKSVKYSNLVAPMIESIKELKKQNEDLQKRLEILENK